MKGTTIGAWIAVGLFVGGIAIVLGFDAGMAACSDRHGPFSNLACAQEATMIYWGGLAALLASFVVGGLTAWIWNRNHLASQFER